MNKFLLILFSWAALLFADTWELKLQRKIEASAFPAWMLEQIQKDLKPFEVSGITTAMLDRIIADNTPWNGSELVRYRIKEGRLYILYAVNRENHDRFHHVTHALTALSQCTQLPDLDFVVSVGDACPYVGDPITFAGPLLCFAKNAIQDDKIILIPDCEALAGHEGLIEEVRRANHDFSWAKKKNAAFWRGASTGTWFTLDNFTAYPRFQLVGLSLIHPKLLDARISHFVQMEEQARQALIDKGYGGGHLSVYDHIQYKYQILVDGNTCSYARAYWQLFSNCLIFKQDSPNIQWFYGALTPNVHFIPVASDFSDLIPKLRKQMDMQRLSQKIIANANAFAEAHLQREDVFLYLYLLLHHYAALQQDT